MAGVLVLAAAFVRLGRLPRLHPLAGDRGLHGRHRGDHLPAAGPGRARRRRSPTARTPPLVAARGRRRRARRRRRCAALGARRARRRRHGRRAAAAPVAAGVAARGRRRDGRRRDRRAATSPRIGALPGVAARAVAARRSQLGELRELLRRRRSRSPLLAAIESLLSAKVADGMADGRRHDPDRELFGQGLANLASPLFGGMPATGAIARTAVNVRAGARTRVAAIVHSLVLRRRRAVRRPASSRAIPLAALAGVLMVTAVRMVEVHNVRAVLRSTRSDALVLVAHRRAPRSRSTSSSRSRSASPSPRCSRCAASPARTASSTEDADRRRSRSTTTTEHELLHEHIVAYRLDGALFFGAAQRFLTELTAVADVRVVILRLPELQVLDATGAQALGEIVAELERRDITVLLKGPRPEHLRVLGAVGALDQLATSTTSSPTSTAVAHARLHAARAPHVAASGDQIAVGAA